MERMNLNIHNQMRDIIAAIAIPSYSVLFAGLFAGSGAATGAIGAAILGHFYPNEAYDIHSLVKMGATGGAIVGAGTGIMKGCQYLLFPNNVSNQYIRTAESIVGMGLNILAGMLGYAILKNITELSLGQVAAAFATGTGVLAGAGLALLCCGFTVMCCLMITNIRPAAAQDPVLTHYAVMA